MRRVKLTNLPTTSTLKSVLALVWGGRVEAIEYTDGNKYAFITFMKPEDCKAYYEATSNGIEYPGSDERIIWVESDPQGVMAINEALDNLIRNNATRVIRAVGVDSDWGIMGLDKIASANNRLVVEILDGRNQSGVSMVT